MTTSGTDFASTDFGFGNGNAPQGSASIGSPLAFQPHRLVRNGTMQTLLARWRPRQADAFLAHEQPILLDAGVDRTGIDPDRPVRLLGYYNRSAAADNRGLVLLLHGWEGCSHAVHNIMLADSLLRAGYDVFRLNFRDHGPGLHANPYALNRGVFFGTLLEEVATATHRIAAMAGDRPFYIAGPSMGGNFALRLAVWHGHDPFHNLARVVAISPAISPGNATLALDRRPLYQRYFRDRWLKSLATKAALFPDLYDFSSLDPTAPVYALTDTLVRMIGAYDSAEAYFDVYAVMGDSFRNLTVPSHIITAADDAVIPVQDFYDLPPHPLLDLQIFPTGGHVGFMDILPFRHFLPGMLVELLDQSSAGQDASQPRINTLGPLQ